MPIVVNIQLMLFRENSMFVKYFDLIEEVTEHLRCPHMSVVAGDLDSKEVQLIHPNTEKHIVRAYYFIPIKPSLV